MQIIALQEYTDKYVSLYQGQIRNIPDQIAQKLIEQNIVAEHGDSEGAGNVVICDIDCKNYVAQYDNQRHDVECKYSFDEIFNMLKNGKIVIAHIYSSAVVGSVDVYIPFDFNSGFLTASKVNQILTHQNTLVIRQISISNLYPGDKSIGMIRYEYKVPIATS